MFLGSRTDYRAPEFLPEGMLTPTHRIVLAHTPTPIQNVALPGLPESCPEVYLKRDDCSGGIELGGNKIRKLEFLLAEAKDQGCDCILTAGGTQSNHCRATTAAGRTVGLPTSLVLRDDFHEEGGNFFLNQLMGADMQVFGREEYTEKGGFEPLLKEKFAALTAAGKKPYLVPVGGSSAIGTWGYIEAFREITEQLKRLEPPLLEQKGGAPFSDIVVTTGSGGTLTGLGVAAKYYRPTRLFNIRAYGVCDNPEYFYKEVNDCCRELFAKTPAAQQPGDAHDWLSIETARGLGYSKASTAELQFLNMVSRQTGVLLDRAYTNKAVFQMVRDLQSGKLAPKGRLMFIHTGGGPSVFDQHEKIIACRGFDEEPPSPQL